MQKFQVWEKNEASTILMGWKSEKSRSQSNVPEVRVGLGGQSEFSNILEFVRAKANEPVVMASNGWINIDLRAVAQSARKVSLESIFAAE